MKRQTDIKTDVKRENIKTKLWHLKVTPMSSDHPFHHILQMKFWLEFEEVWQVLEVNPTPRPCPSGGVGKYG